MVKYNYQIPSKTYYILEGRYPIGATFYNANGEAIYEWKTSGLKYSGTDVEPVPQEIALVKGSSCPDGYTAVSLSNDALLMIGSSKASGGSHAIKDHSHTHSYSTQVSSSETRTGYASISSVSNSNASYKYIKYKLCVLDYDYRGVYE